ncbi:MAG: hypothetical protein GY759_01255, partial [Chloroflexi bacterium]|nr:hypothetical protein [Chloroflexota bacterium]
MKKAMRGIQRNRSSNLIIIISCLTLAALLIMPGVVSQATAIDPQFIPYTCQELVTNGGFETNAAWTLPVTGASAKYTTAEAHTGARSVRLGQLPAQASTLPAGKLDRNLMGEIAPQGSTYSTVYQDISIPNGADQVTLD